MFFAGKFAPLYPIIEERNKTRFSNGGRNAYRYWSMQSQSLGSFSKWNQPGSLSTGRMVPRRWPSKHLRASLNVHLDHDCPWRCCVSRVSPVTHDRGIGQTNIEFDSIRFHLVRIHLVQRFARKINVDSIYEFREISRKEKNKLEKEVRVSIFFPMELNICDPTKMKIRILIN